MDELITTTSSSSGASLPSHPQTSSSSSSRTSIYISLLRLFLLENRSDYKTIFFLLHFYAWPWHYLPQPSRRPLKRLVQQLELLPLVPSPRIFAGVSSSEELLLPDFPVASLSLITGFLRWRTLPLTPTIGIGTGSGRRRSLLLLMPSPNVANLWCPTSACIAWSWRAQRNSLSADAMKGRQRRSERVRVIFIVLCSERERKTNL